MKKSLYMLGILEDRDLEWLHEAGTVREIDDDETLIAIKTPFDDLYFIIEGTFRIVLGNGDSPGAHSVGDIAGEMAFVERRLPGGSIIASGPGKVLAVPRTAIRQRFVDDQGFEARFYHALAMFLSDRLRTITSGASKDTPEELDDDILDNVHIAGERFVRLIDLLAGRRG